MKNNNGLFELFVEQLEDILSAEHQILECLPKMIKNASLPDLKEALSNHLEETEHQVQRIERILDVLNLESKSVQCEAMKGLIEEAEEMMKNRQQKSPALDAAIIAAAQKIEHYEMATYGTLRSFATHCELDEEVTDLLQESLDEEGAADKKLTKIADGSFFSSGVNKTAASGSSKRTSR